MILRVPGFGIGQFTEYHRDNLSQVYQLDCPSEYALQTARAYLKECLVLPCLYRLNDDDKP
jgi:hypothetical protein